MMTLDAYICVALIGAFLLVNLLVDIGSEYEVAVVRTLLLAGVSLSSTCAFITAHIQLPGIIGQKGIFPVEETLETVKEYLSQIKLKKSLTLTERIMTGLLNLVYEKYHTTGDYTKHIKRIAQVDIVLALGSLVYPHPLLFLYQFVSYYAIKRVGGRFFNFQWDALLLETLILATVLSMTYDSVTNKIGVWIFKILLFRLMLGSGIVKYFSGDASWSKDFTAMSFHFLTQPLPNQLGMYVYNHLSDAGFKAMTVGTLLVEGIVPLLPFTTLPCINTLTSVLYILLQLSISATGYYGFFNYHTIVLSLSLLDDGVVTWIMRSVLGDTVVARLLEVLSIHSYYSASARVRVLTLLGLLGRLVCCCVVYPALVVVFCADLVALQLLVEQSELVEDSIISASISADWTDGAQQSESPPTHWKRWLCQAYLYLRTVCGGALTLYDTATHTLFLGSHYGLFAHMTKIRNEIIIEVSNDKTHWYSVEFLAKPGDPDLPPKVLHPIFHLPRVDWVFWFLAFKPSVEQLPKWFWNLVVSIMEGDNAEVLGLLHPTLNQQCFAAARADQAERIIVSQASSTESVQEKTPLFRYVRIRLLNYNFTGRSAAAAGNTRHPLRHQTGAGTPDAAVQAEDEVVSGVKQGIQDEIRAPARQVDENDGEEEKGAEEENKVPAVQRVQGKCWSVLPIRTILPPAPIEMIYAILDTFDDRIHRRAKERTPPKPETAADIIMRTLFSHLIKKKE